MSISTITVDRFGKISVILGGVFIVYLSWKSVRTHFSNTREKKKLAHLRNERQARRKEELEALQMKYRNEPQKFETIMQMSMTEVQSKLFNREILAQDVLISCVRKSLEANEKFNCVTEFIPDAWEKARTLDELHMVKGPLHGIPFCVKDDTAVLGFDCTLGCSKFIGNISNETAVIVQSLEKLGAIPFCRTNVPQTCISFGSANPIFGKTLNPLRPSLGPGGSSSGSACLVASGGCWFGTGSDTGGSLRVPAHFCGLSTLKATSSRISRRGCTKCVDQVPAVPGIISRNAKDQAMIFKALTDHNLQNKMDASVVPISWNSSAFESKQKLRIGYTNDFSIVHPLVGDTASVLDKAKVFLESSGHILVPFKLPFSPFSVINTEIDEGIRRKLQTLLEHDEISPSVQEAYEMYCKNSSRPSFFNRIFTTSSKGAEQPSNSREDLIHTFLDEMTKNEIDILICPVFPLPAVDVEKLSMMDGVVLFTMFFNILDLPSGVVKFWVESGNHWRSSVDAIANKNDGHKKALLQMTEACRGMPISVQVVGKPFQEELVFKVMAELDDINNA